MHGNRRFFRRGTRLHAIVSRHMRLSKRCFAVTGLAVIPPWCVNAGFVVGDETTLVIDTGANAFAAATIHGYSTLAREQNRLLVINLEKHFDHIGGNRSFRERGIDVLGHPGIQRTEQEFAAEIAEFNAAIPNRARREREEAKVFYSGTTLTMPNKRISEETVIELGDCPVQVLMTPGHTETNLSVYVPEDGVLYCGDCLVNGYLPNLDAGTAADWKQWIHSIERMARLQPRVVVPGHGHVATGDDVFRMMDRMVSILRKAIAEGRSPTAD